MHESVIKGFARPAPRSLMRLRVMFRLRALREWLSFDCRAARTVFGIVTLISGLTLLMLGRRQSGAQICARAHRTALNPAVSRIVERLFRNAVAGGGGALARALRAAVREYPAALVPDGRTARFFADPQRLLNGCGLVLKSPGVNERGVLYLYYSYVYPLFMRAFDMPAIERRYHIVLEPSWSGYCDLNILSLSVLENPVFVGSIEPRDSEFLACLGGKFVVADIGGNTWVDPEVFKPIPGESKDIDIVYVGSWSAYKRHWALFKALAVMRSRGTEPRVALVGYPIEFSARDVFDQACALGVEDLIELHERLTAAEVNVLLNRSKVNVIWSRREGLNRAIIEGMAANVPCVVRAGFNYGYAYPYVNGNSGCFAQERELPDVLARMLKEYARYQPRAEVVSRMTPQASTQRLNAAIRATALALGETWTTDIVVRTGTIDGLQHANPEDRRRFETDYAFLRSCIRRGMSV